MFSEKQGVEESYPCSTLTKLPTASTQVQQIKACHLEMVAKVAWKNHDTPHKYNDDKDIDHQNHHQKTWFFFCYVCLALSQAHTDLNTPFHRKLHGKLPKFSLNQMFPWKKKTDTLHMIYICIHWSVTHGFFSGKNPESSNPITGHIPSIKLHLILSSWGRGLENSETATPVRRFVRNCYPVGQKKNNKSSLHPLLPLPLMLISGDSKKNTTATVQILWMFRSKQILP